MSKLSFSQHRHHVERLIEAALAAADPAMAVRRNLRLSGQTLVVGDVEYDIGRGRVFIIAAGKAATAMGTAAAEILGSKLAAGVLIDKRDKGALAEELTPTVQLPRSMVQRFAGHPVPDEAGVLATAEVIDMLDETALDDLVLCFISGGASALLTHPVLPLPQWQRLVDILLASGCTINELNAVRKRLDRVKGGGLARLSEPAACASLILSDVVGNPLDVIGSGPTVPNPNDPALPARILHRYRVDQQLSPEEWAAVSGQLEHLATETPPTRCVAHNIIIGDVRRAAEAATDAAKDLGFDARQLTTHLEGEAREVGRVVAALAKDAASNTCLILGGETTVTVTGDGLGGRNQELALAAAIALDGWPERVVATFATDGDDGPTDAAGGLVTGQTLDVARRLGLQAGRYLDNNDSHHFLEATSSLIRTGQTGTNVNDLAFVLTYDRALTAHD